MNGKGSYRSVSLTKTFFFQRSHTSHHEKIKPSPMRPSYACLLGILYVSRFISEVNCDYLVGLGAIMLEAERPPT